MMRVLLCWGSNVSSVFRWHLLSFRRSSNNNPDSSVHDRNITGEPVINTRLHYIKVSRVSLAKKLQLRWQVMDRETSFIRDVSFVLDFGLLWWTLSCTSYSLMPRYASQAKRSSNESSVSKSSVKWKPWQTLGIKPYIIHGMSRIL